MQAGIPGVDSYGALIDRAYLALREAGGELSEADLAARVFGAGPAGGLWVRLLGQVLETDARFLRLSGGRWALKQDPLDAMPLGQPEFVALDLKAAGPKPWVHRLLDVAALHLGPQGEIAAFATLLNPQQRLPKYVVSLTGVRPEDAAESPLFASVADDLLDFLGSKLLVGHGLAVQVAYLQYELRRLGKPGLSNQMLDTLDLAALLLPDLGKPSLDNLARRLDDHPPLRHFALADARAAGRIACRLLALASERGYATVGEIRAAIERKATASVFADASQATRPRLLLDSRHGVDVPSLPGVYALRDRRGQVLYVGKAGDLRHRLGAYINRPLGYTRQMEGLVETVDSVEALPVDTELEALLLEARLIRKHRPPFNVQRRVHLAPAFIRIDTSEPFPRLQARALLKVDGALYFGPFRSGSQLRRTLGLLRRLLPLRTCARALGKPRRRPQARPPCTRLGGGACIGPCVGSASAATYATLVDEAVELLRGEKERALEQLRARLRQAVQARDPIQEKALRDAIRSVIGMHVDWLAFSTGMPVEAVSFPGSAGVSRPPSPSPSQVITYGAAGPLSGRGGRETPALPGIQASQEPASVEMQAGGRAENELPLALVYLASPGSLLLVACLAADARGVVVFALGEGALLGQRRLGLPLDAEEVESFLAEAAIPSEIAEEQAVDFSLAMRWVARNPSEAVLVSVQGGKDAPARAKASADLAERAGNRWPELPTTMDKPPPG